mmetsp:Transcript_15498/g.25368  ORF Transcript_15498/g.25368 Transcript_15498/m.25368 type:complete len:322 (-) Transcript_15498:743-1708(-)
MSRLILIGVCWSVVALGQRRNGNPFFIGKDEESKTLVKLKSSQGIEYTCELAHKTKGVEEDELKLAEKAQSQNIRNAHHGIHRDIESILGKLSGICIRKTIDYWKYQLCFDSKITQSHGRDSFELGRYSGMDGSFQLYDGGTRCPPANPEEEGKQRESRVEFFCESTLRIASVEEVSVCSYKVYVSTPIVCGHPDFKQDPRSIPGKQARLGKSGPPKDSWFLEIMEDNAGKISCSASSLKTTSDVQFSNFGLSLSVSSSSEVELKTQQDIVRNFGRRTLSKSAKQYEVQREMDNKMIVLKNGREFSGHFVHAFLQAVPVLS